MKAPDTIYIAPNHYLRMFVRAWFDERHDDTDVAYVRADLSAYELGKIIEAQKAEIARLTTMAFMHAPGDMQFAPEGWTWQQAYEHLIHQDEAEIARLREALREHGNHKRNCEQNDDGDDCTCGFTAALKGEV